MRGQTSNGRFAEIEISKQPDLDASMAYGWHGVSCVNIGGKTTTYETKIRRLPGFFEADCIHLAFYICKVFFFIPVVTFYRSQ